MGAGAAGAGMLRDPALLERASESTVMNALLDALGVSVRGPDGYLVEPISLTMRAGIPMTIVGETGSGKSLLLQALMGTLPAGLRAAGTATICADIFDLSAASDLRKLWGRTISILPQEPWLALDPLMRSREQVAEVYRLVGSDTGASAHALADLKAVGLAAAETRLPGEFSGGMAQRLAFSAARAGGGHLQFADEPTKGLDTSMRNDVANLLLGRLASTGGLLTVTHDLDLARRLGGEIMVMLEGKVVEHAPADRLFEAPSHAYTKRLIDAQPSNWSTRPTSAEPGPRVLSARKLSVERGGRKLFEGVDIDFTPGQIVGVYGPSGCGKTTLGNALLGLIPTLEGKVVREVDISRTRFQKLWQDPPSAFARTQTIGSELEAVAKLHKVGSGRIDDLRKKLRLPASLFERLPSQVSGGELQRIALLRSLMANPVFLFADEPTSRLDPVTQQEVIEFLGEVVREEKLALLIVSHDSDLLERTCDFVIALKGAIVEPNPCKPKN
jgi:ABC-type glutathione transport system ATPase component